MYSVKHTVTVFKNIWDSIFVVVYKCMYCFFIFIVYDHWELIIASQEIDHNVTQAKSVWNVWKSGLLKH